MSKRDYDDLDQELNTLLTEVDTRPPQKKARPDIVPSQDESSDDSGSDSSDSSNDNENNSGDDELDRELNALIAEFDTQPPPAQPSRVHLGEKDNDDVDKELNILLDEIEANPPPRAKPPKSASGRSEEKENNDLDRELKVLLAEVKTKPARKKTQRKSIHSPEEAAAKKKRADKQEAIRLWNKGLVPWIVDGNHAWSAGTICMLKKDAKVAYGVTDNELKTLPYENVAVSRKSFYSMDDVVNLAVRKFHTGAYKDGLTTKAGQALVERNKIKVFKKTTGELKSRVKRYWVNIVLR